MFLLVAAVRENAIAIERILETLGWKPTLGRT